MHEFRTAGFKSRCHFRAISTLCPRGIDHSNGLTILATLTNDYATIFHLLKMSPWKAHHHVGSVGFLFYDFDDLKSIIHLTNRRTTLRGFIDMCPPQQQLIPYEE